MSQKSFTIPNVSRPQFRIEVNESLQALASNSSGATAPATTYANQTWYDTANDQLKIRSEDNSSWITLYTITATYLDFPDIRRNGSQVYSRNNIVGTVSQSGGVPTGAVIERGSNANGSYTRWADGTQICTYVDDQTAFAWNVASGNLWRSSQGIWVYPMAFVSGQKPVISGLVETNIVAIMTMQSDTTTNTQTNWRGGSSITLGTSTAKFVHFQATGRWF